MDSTPAECECEDRSHYHRGDGPGFGLVLPAEELIFAVFLDDRPSDRTEVTGDDFDSKQLHKAEQSVARRTWTDRVTFERDVVAPAIADRGALLGVACAVTENLRSLDYTVKGLFPPKSGRAVCVLDKVEPSDHRGHAALAFSESQATLTPKQKKSVRATIRTDLASAFGMILALENVLVRSDAAD